MTHKSEHEAYEYTKKEIIGRADALQCIVAIYEVPPGKAAYPYHYHLKNEEVFYILEGEGELYTPEGKKRIGKGDFMFFPCDSSGHKLVNASETEMLVYIDFDTKNDIDVTYYPDSKKIAVWGKETNVVFNEDDTVDYYEGE